VSYNRSMVEFEGPDELERLDVASLRERAKRAIRASIMAGEVASGQNYPVAYFAERLGVSGTPIREALFDLAATGLIESVRGRGFRIPTLTEDELDELFELRLMLELPGAVRLAAERRLADPDRFYQLAQAIESRVSANDLFAVLRLDRDFHLQLIGLLGNRRLVDMVGHIRDQVRLYGIRHLMDDGHLRTSIHEHGALVHAMVEGDVAETETIMRHHLAHTRGVWAGRAETTDPSHRPAAIISPEVGSLADGRVANGASVQGFPLGH